MLKREQIELILKTNGIDPSSPNEVIRSVLLSARFNDDEINTAIMVLRENPISNTSRVDALHKVFRTDQSLKSSEITSLLGIEVNVDNLKIQRTVEAKRNDIIHAGLVVVLAIALALLGVFTAMYIYDVGIFYPTINQN